MIEFLCPQGHRIRCPDEQAGRAAKCPRCGIKFRIPSPEDASAPAAADEKAPAAESTGSSVASPSASGVGRSAAAPKEEQIEFLCPNGHHLHGPASLQGKPGECPECGSRFRIPLLDEMSVGDDEAAPTDGGLSIDDSMSTEGEVEAAGSSVDVSGDMVTAQAAGMSSPSVLLSPEALANLSSAANGVHPMGELFAQLWAAKDSESRVEVHLESGGVILPDAYVKSLSGRANAVLVSKDPDGSFTVTLVPWNTVARVILRGMKRVPGEVVR